MCHIRNLVNFRKYVGIVLIITCLVGLQTVFSLVNPLIIQKYIDSSLISIDYKLLLLLTCTYIVVCIILYVMKLLVTYMSEKLGWKYTNELRIQLIRKILSYDQNFFVHHSVGDMLERLDKDLNILFHFIANKLVNILTNFLLLMGILVMFYSNNWITGIVFTVFALLSLVIIYFAQKTDSNILYQEREYSTTVTSTYGQWLNMKKEMDILNKTNYISEKFNIISEKLLQLKVKSQKYLYRVWSVTLLLLAAANILTLIIGGFLYLHNVITIGMVYLLYSYSNLLKEPFENLQSQIQAILSVKAVIKRLEKIITYIPEVTDGERIISTFMPVIEFKNVTYCYDNVSEPALKNINVLINKGGLWVISGESGSGKSTFCKILCKLIEVKQGQVFIDNMDISELSVRDIRNNTAYISIDSHIFNHTLKNNLTLFNDKITEGEIEKVLIKYNLLHLFSKGDANFLSKEISESLISAGQKQLICLCRILFKNKKIVIFDESSSRINQDIEKIFDKIIKDISEKSIMIVISHNLRQTKDFTRTINLENGTIL